MYREFRKATKSTRQDVTPFLMMLLILLPSASHAETIKLKSGKTITAEILERTEAHIKVNFQDIPLAFDNDEIESISLDKAEENPLSDKSNSENPRPAGPQKVIENINDSVMAKMSQSVVVVMAERVNKPFLYGTGFFISNDGLIATNFHVVFNADNITIKTKKGRTCPVKGIVYYDDKKDFCILKSDMSESPGLTLGDSEDLFAGQKIFTVGHPQGHEYKITRGQYLRKMPIDGTEMLMTTLDTETGNSGAPIMDKDGRVIGVSVLSSSSVEGYNFGIPINAVKNFLHSGQEISTQNLKRRINKAYELTYAGDGALLAGKHQEAANYYQQALGADPDYLNAFIGLGKAYRSLNMQDEAFDNWLEVQKRDPQNASAHAFLGESYLDRNMLDEAIANLKKAVSLGPQSVHVHNNLGIAYGNKGMLDEAIAVYQKTIEMDPYYANGYFNLAVAYFKKADIPQAKKYCVKAIQLGHEAPDNFVKLLGIQ